MYYRINRISSDMQKYIQILRSAAGVGVGGAERRRDATRVEYEA